MNGIRRSCLAALALLVLAVPARAAELRAGVAKVEITPPAGEKLWGYFNRTQPAEGALDPLFARVVVLEASGKKMALAVLDLGRTFGPAGIARLRAAARQSSGMDYVLVQATHTHAAPVILDDYPEGKTPAWESAVIEKTAAAIAEAARNLAPARLGTGRGSAFIGYNRIRINPDGTVTMFWRNETRVPTAPMDPTVAVVRLDTSDGTPLAVLVNHACHPVIFAWDNLQYTADFPGFTVKAVEEAIPGATAIFLQGAPGDINPYFATQTLEKNPVAQSEWTGRRLGEEAARVARSIRTEADENASLDFVEDALEFKLRWNPEKFRAAIIAAYGENILESFAPRLQGPLSVPVAVVLINKRLAMMTMPGEPFVDFQISWRDRAPVREALFLGYANGYVGYFPTIRGAAMGGYGAASATTWVEVGAGERMVDHALVRLYEMIGRLRDKPE
jgi:hypothetical protein